MLSSTRRNLLGDTSPSQKPESPDYNKPKFQMKEFTLSKVATKSSPIKDGKFLSFFLSSYSCYTASRTSS